MEERWNEPTDGGRERGGLGRSRLSRAGGGGAQKIGNIRDDGIVPPFSRWVSAALSSGWSLCQRCYELTLDGAEPICVIFNIG